MSSVKVLWTGPRGRAPAFCLLSLFPAEILQANDKLSQALRHYRQVVVSHENSGGGVSGASSTDAAGKEHPAASHDSSAPARHL